MCLQCKTANKLWTPFARYFSCYRGLLFIRCRKRAGGNRGEISQPTQRRPVAPGQCREERQAGQPAGGPVTPGGPESSNRRTHTAGIVQPALCW